MGTSQPILSNTKLANEITLLAGQINAATYRFLKLIAQFDSREAWAEGGIRSCAHWLNWKCGIVLGAAREKIRVAHALEALPQINQAFAQGVISYSKVRAMTRVATNDNENYLLTLAKHGTAHHIEQVVKKYQKVARLVDGENNPISEEVLEDQQRSFSSHQDEQGMWIINAKLSGETGALVVKAIEAILLQEQQKSAQENVSAETSFETKVEEKTFPQRRADALAKMAEHYLASKTADNNDHTQSLAGNERCQIMLHVDINTLRENSRESQQPQHHHCHEENNRWISPDTAKRLSCDASLVTVLEDNKGNVLNIGRRSRTIPPAIQRALSIRDGSCRIPGCCSTHYLDAHHIKHWADGGETNLDNLVMLCRHHHRALHRGEISIQIKETKMTFAQRLSNGKQQTIEQSFFPQFKQTTSSHDLAKYHPEIDSETAVTKWQGEPIDYSMAVDGLSSLSRS